MKGENLTRYIASATGVPVFEPGPAYAGVFVVDGQVDVSKAFGDADAVVDARVSRAHDDDFERPLVFDWCVVEAERCVCGLCCRGRRSVRGREGGRVYA